ncbi:MAG TPA: sugar phosphate nucleotidyltransferase [Methanothrix sp.]|nr:NTP transferase domain-containing protein [Methanothrix sp.]HOV81629.1 sugar phosphate nucleotidyltransferase [Methanothrix sp.]HPC88765.1 sugar phosphate nucleotidyltransferase [Methanothrix sp.]HQE86831.1 sugar phosphate nucleotidyltransferase [Methanothrix sp.]HQI68774.1 sugar phosphate nucleotidyltransferase [Methanothrix sp.]
MQAIILAAGEGSRMRPLTARRPKVMLPVAGRPILEHILLRAKSAGVDRAVLVVGYGRESVRSHFGDGSRLGMKIDYALQEQQLGTGHALLAAESLAEERFIVMNGDVLPDEASLQRMAAGGPAVSAIAVEDPRRYGVFTEEAGRFISVVEKSKRPPSNLANAGIYLLERSIFSALREAPLSPRGEYELTDGLNRLAGREAISIVKLKSWLEIGRPWDILAANEALLKDLEPQMLGTVESGAVLAGSVSVGKNTRIMSGAYIEGPAVIGEGCKIGPNCYIRPATCLEGGVRVGNAVEVKNSAIMAGSKIGHLSYVGDSVIGEGCNFGAGTICSNLRHDKGNIKSYIKGDREDSGLRKLGVIMGDGVMTGINTSIYPGTVIEPGFRGLPAAVLKGLVRAFSAPAQIT